MSNQQRAKSIGHRTRGVTLLELLIAVAIFAFLCSLLSGLLNTSLNLWRTGEKTGDIYDRYQLILEQLRHDFESIYAEKESYELVKRIFPDVPLSDYISNREPSFYVGRDPAGNYWFYLVRTQDQDLYTLSPVPSRKFSRVLYYLNPAPESGTTSLVRTILSQSAAREFWSRDDPARAFPAPSSSDLVFDGVLYLGLKLWDGADQKEDWDSLTAEAKDRQPSSDQNVVIPEQFLPGAIEIELALSPTVFPPPKIQLVTDIDSSAETLNVTTTQGLPDPPDYVKIGPEWIRYREFSYKQIQVDSRGSRGTQAVAHPRDAVVIYGETIKRVYYLTTTDNK